MKSSSKCSLVFCAVSVIVISSFTGAVKAVDPEITKANVRSYPGMIYGMMYAGVDYGSQFSDFNDIKIAGFDIIEPDLTWNCIEGIQGTYDWSMTDRMVSRAQTAGLKVSFKICLWNQPSWLTQKMISNSGETGDCPEMHDSFFRQRYRLLWQQIAQRYRNNSTVVLYCPTFGIQDAPYFGTLDMNKAPGPNRLWDYGASAQTSWRTFLQSKGVTIATINQWTGKNYQTWNDVMLPLPGEYDADTNAYWYKYVEFLTWSVEDAYLDICSTIRAEDTQTGIILKVGGVIYEQLIRGQYRNAQLEICTDYDVVFNRTGSDPLAHNETYSICNTFGNVPWIAENAFPQTSNNNVRTVGGVAQNGGNMAFYCYWQAGQPTSEWLNNKSNASKIANHDPVRDNLVLCDFYSLKHYNTSTESVMQENTTSYFDNLTKSGYQYSMIIDTVGDANAVGNVWVDTDSLRFDTYHCSLVNAFLAAGGTVVFNNLSDKNNNYDFLKTFVTVTPRTSNGTVTVNTDGTAVQLDSRPGIYFGGTFNQTIATWNGGTNAAVMKQVGAGKAIFIGFPLLKQISDGTDSDLTALYKILDYAGVKRNISITTGTYGLECAVSKANGGKRMFSLMNLGGSSQQGSAVVKGPSGFAESMGANVSPYSLQVFDLHQKMVAAIYNRSANTSLVTYQNMCGGTWVDLVSNFSGRITGLALDDYNHSGQVKMLVGCGNQVYQYTQNADTAFGNQSLLLTLSGTNYTVAGLSFNDCNADGNRDLLISANSSTDSKIYKYEYVNGVWNYIGVVATNSDPSLTYAGLDQGTKIGTDMFLIRQDANSRSILHGNCDSNLTAILTNTDTNVKWDALSCKNIDGDGLLEIYVALNFVSNDISLIRKFKDNGYGTFIQIGDGFGINTGLDYTAIAITSDPVDNMITQFAMGCSQMRSDFNNDCTVDFGDLMLLAQNWLKSGMWPTRSYGTAI
ncbi:MAG: hypothetical protein A2Y12_17890 [Planctomycetes bacterium GWF2_42_9]|nr:MAG: hypothetical protein A2Y12_17890 [Planctomycetes bacterium GWF2_42_9]